MTLADVLAEIKKQLDWRGPSDKTQGHVVLPREMAEYLHPAVIQLIKDNDELWDKVESHEK